MELPIAKKYFPEYKQVLREAGGYNPRKFVQAMRVVVTPATFNPSAQGDFAFTHSFDWNGETLRKGPAYSYDTMMSSHVGPYERTVSVPAGHRVWITTYDGQWGGFWSHVLIFVNANELPARCAELLEISQAPKKALETTPSTTEGRLVEAATRAIPHSQKWAEALQACDRAFSGRELLQMCHDYGKSPAGHKKELCRRLYDANCPEVVAIMQPYADVCLEAKE